MKSAIPFLIVLLTAVASFGQQKPNIIFILTDDLGYGDLGVLFQNAKAGSKKLSTPKLDAMAGEGMILNRHYCPAPVCAPSRASLLAGVHQGHANVRNNQFDKELENNHTLANTLKTAGYYTAAIGKWGLQGSGSTPAAWPSYPTKRGFDYFYGYVTHVAGHQHYPANSWPLGNSSGHRSPQLLYENNTEISSQLDKCYTTDLFTARAKKLIVDHTNSSPTQPFFIYLAYDTPHAALQLPTMAYPSGSGLTGGLQWVGTSGNMINTAAGTIDSFYHPLYAGQSWNDREKRFATMVTRIDNCVGDLLQTLKDLNIDDNTIVVFSSDNGPHSESYMSSGNYAPTSFKSYGPFEGMKRDGHEGGIRVPTLAWGPGNVQAGATSNHPSQFHDWLTTFCDLADIPSPARSDGVSLAPTLTGTGNQETGTVYVEYDTGGSTPNYGDFSNHGGTSRNELQVVYLDGYKGIRNNTTSHSVNFRIYDTLTDLKESNNLAGTSPYFTQLQQRMKDRVLQLRRPNSSASRAYDNEFVPSVSPPVENGLEYQSYEGNWQWVPEFSAMTAVGGSDAADISTTHLSRNNDAGLLYTGYINVPTDGDWTFYTSSDAGTVLRIHDCLVIDDDFNHNGSETSASIKLKAGLHPFRLYYRTASSQPNLNLSWSGPGIAKQSIPGTSFRRDGTPPPEPIANDDQAFTSGTAPVSISVLANDSDDGQPQPLSIQSVSQLALGTATINGNNILYTAAAGKFGQDHFTYTITDGTHTATANVVVDVTVPIANRIWIPLNECDGAIIREAGGTTVGTMAGFADVDAAHIVGKYGHALRFDGVDDQVSLTGVTLPTGNSARTVSAWVRTSSTSPAELQVVFGYGINSNGQRFSIRLDGSATQRLRLEVQGGFIVGSTQLNDGQWHHIAVVVDDFNSNGTTNVNEARLYVDGQRETISSSGSRAIDTSASGGSLIGGSPHAANYSFTGDIDELQIHSSALTDAEVLSLANLDNQTSALWLYRQFANNPPAWNSDDDLDGSELLAEYAFGGNPHISDRNQLTPTVTYNSNDDVLEISYTRRKSDSHNLTYSLQVSDDLSTWTLPSNEISAVPHPVLGTAFEWVHAKADPANSSNGKLFIRAHAETN